MNDSYASKIVLFIFGVIFFVSALTIQNCTRHPIPETLVPDITETPDLTSNPGKAGSPQPAQTSHNP
jgi:hypothetical protein